jgi:hypothetical protein
MAIVASIGKLFSDGGLLSLLTESNVYAEATARQMLEGKQIARDVRGIKLVMDALYILYLESMESMDGPTRRRSGACRQRDEGSVE